MKFATRTMVAVWLTVLGALLSAQTVGPLLKGQDKGRSCEMILEELRVECEILGVLSETRMTMVFYNPNDRVMEGELTFPLPLGATVSGYALDVDGRMVDGVAVDKDKARRVFETEVRRGVDPGIVEQLAGNHFRTRVYPLPALGRRTVMVRYIGELDRRGQSAFYRLPLSLPYILKKISIRIQSLGERIQPEMDQSPLADLHFINWHQAYIAQGNAENIRLQGDMVIELPDAGRQRFYVQTTTRGQTYFYAWDQPGRAEPVAGAVPVRRLTLFWDASGSRADSDHRREFEFLRAWFRLQAQPVTVRLVLLRNGLDRPDIMPEVRDAEELIRRLQAVDYDGATNLDALAQDKEPSDISFLFSDGLGSFDHGSGRYRQARLYAVCATDGADYERLRWLAEQSGAESINLKAEDPQTAARRVGRPVFQYLGLTPETTGVDQVYPSLPRSVADDQIVCGRMRQTGCRIGLSYGRRGKSEQVSELDTAVEPVMPGNLLETFWAYKKVAELAQQAERNDEDIRRTASQYGLVTALTSLIVLERLDQYIEHGIMPPESLPQLRQQYRRHIDDLEAQRKGREKSKMERVLAMWRERLDWYGTDFSKLPAPKEDKRKMSRSQEATAELPAALAGGVSADEAPAPVREIARDQAVSAKSMTSDKDRNGSRTVTVTLKAFDPQTPYLHALQAAAPDEWLRVYMTQRRQFSDSPSFFVDCADFFYQKKMADLALRVLSNLAELKLEDPQLLRVLAGRLTLHKQPVLAGAFYEKILKLRPEEPQSYRDLALQLADLGQYRRAVELLNQVIFQDWDRFNGIEIVALMELNEIIRRAKQAGIDDLPVSPAFVQAVNTDLRLVLSWDADATDIDLHVVEPTGEEVCYSHKLSSSGGLVSNDFTQGYGPEEYVVRRAISGSYRIRVRYYGSQSQRLLGPVTVRVDIFTHFNRPGQQKRTVLLRLEDKKEMADVAEVKW